jgi:hypothetical protein
MQRITCDRVSFEVQLNTAGWGPVSSAEVPGVSEIPELAEMSMRYAHFDKKDKITRAADVNPSSNQYRGDNTPQRFAVVLTHHVGNRNRRDDPSGTNADFLFKPESGVDATFHLVDMSKTRSRPGTSLFVCSPSIVLTHTTASARTVNSRKQMGRGGRIGRGGQQGPRAFNQGTLYGLRSQSLRSAQAAVEGKQWDALAIVGTRREEEGGLGAEDVIIAAQIDKRQSLWRARGKLWRRLTSNRARNSLHHRREAMQCEICESVCLRRFAS